MRKSLVMLVSIIFLALACPSADAAISWDSAYSVFHYGVQNTGNFTTPANRRLYPYLLHGSPRAGHLWGIRHRQPFLDSRCAWRYSAERDGQGTYWRSQPTAWFTGSGLCGNRPHLFNGCNGVDVGQNVVSYVTRRFRVTTNRFYDVRATLSGVVNFNDFFYSGSYRATHSVKGTVELYESFDDFNQDINLIYSWTLNQSPSAISGNVNLLMSTNARYELKIVLTLNSKLVNFYLSGGTPNISGAVPRVVRTRWAAA